jgi:hypothetical protein
MAIAGRKLERGPFFGVFKNSDRFVDPLEHWDQTSQASRESGPAFGAGLKGRNFPRREPGP